MDRLERLEAIEAIRSLKARYFRLLDTKQWDELREVFTTDMKVLTPEGQVYAEGGAGYAAALRNSLERAVSCHQGLMGEVEVIDVTCGGVMSSTTNVPSAAKAPPVRPEPTASTLQYYVPSARPLVSIV